MARGLRELALLHAREPEAAMGFRKLRGQAHGLLECRRGLATARLRAQDQAAGLVLARIVRVLAERALDGAERRGRVARGKLEEREEVQAIGMVRLSAEKLVAELAARREAARGELIARSPQPSLRLGLPGSDWASDILLLPTPTLSPTRLLARYPG